LNSYGRIAYDINDNNEIYGTLNIAQVEIRQPAQPGRGHDRPDDAVLQPVPAGCRSCRLRQPGITSFTFGTSNALLPRNISVHPTRTQYRGVIGADGKFAAFGTDWHYDAYYTHGENTTNIHVNNIMLNPRYRQAIQATLLNGQIVCADPSPAPMAASRSMSSAVSGPATRRWPTSARERPVPALGPEAGRRQHQLQRRAHPGWAGPVALAFGAEYRREAYHVQGDPYGDGSAASPYSADYPADPLLSTAGNNWYAGNYHSGAGKYSVKEAYAEVNVPLVDSEAAGKANLNAAGRWTDYSTSGTVYTWKVGGTWDTPIDGVRLRAVTSRDVRAPNLSELFAAPVTTTLPNFTIPSTVRPPGPTLKDLARCWSSRTSSATPT
jgi:iron complex outermembrane receptor protein